MGSIIQATPFLHALKEEYSNSNIDLLTFSENRFIAESLGIFRHVYTLDHSSGFFNFIWNTIKFIIRKWHKYILIIDLEFFASFSTLIVKLLASSYTIGFGSFIKCRNRCYSCTVIFDHSNHIRLIFLKFLNAININKDVNIRLIKPHIPSEKLLSTCGKLPRLNDISLKIAVNINTGDICQNRRWPEENFCKLIDFIQNDFDSIQIYLVGSKKDLSFVKFFYESLPNKKDVHVVAGKLDILEFSWVLSKMAYLITNDSGPLHISEAVGTPVVCFFGPETPNLYGPMLKSSIVFYKNLYCSPCLNTYNIKRSHCKDNQCLKLITAEEVYFIVKPKLIEAFHNVQ